MRTRSALVVAIPALAAVASAGTVTYTFEGVVFSTDGFIPGVSVGQSAVITYQATTTAHYTSSHHADYRLLAASVLIDGVNPLPFEPVPIYDLSYAGIQNDFSIAPPFIPPADSLTLNAWLPDEYWIYVNLWGTDETAIPDLGLPTSLDLAQFSTIEATIRTDWGSSVEFELTGVTVQSDGALVPLPTGGAMAAAGLALLAVRRRRA